MHISEFDAELRRREKGEKKEFIIVKFAEIAIEEVEKKYSMIM